MALYSMPDHSPPPFELIERFCRDVSEWLSADPAHVAAIHCKAGKGRTGTMITCFLLFSGLCENTDEAVKLFGNVRTRDGRGVTIQSQLRYVRYFERLLRQNLNYSAPKTTLRRIVLECSDSNSAKRLTDSASFIQFNLFCPHFSENATLALNCDLDEAKTDPRTFAFQVDRDLIGDVKVSAKSRKRIFSGGNNAASNGTQRLSFRSVSAIEFHCWFNTFFLEFISTEIAPAEGSSRFVAV